MSECTHEIEDRDNWLEEVDVYVCKCGKRFTTEDLVNRIHELKSEVDDADRRAGRAERRFEDKADTLFKMKRAQEQRKEALGYDINASFDIVWEDLIELAGGEAWVREELLKLPNARRRRN